MTPPIPSSPAAVESVLDALRFDALSEAERVTGKSYKTDKATEAIGFGLHLRKVQETHALLESIGDTSFRRTAAWTLARMMQDGFDIVLTEPFVGYPGESNYDERLYVLFCKRRGVLVKLETYGRGSEHNPEGSCNHIDFLFNWRPAHADARLESYSGHGFVDPEPLFAAERSEYNPEGKVYGIVGYIDGREGMFTRLQWMEQNGRFLTPWIEQPWMWFLTYQDTKTAGCDHNAITAARVAKLPEEVRRAIKG